MLFWVSDSQSEAPRQLIIRRWGWCFSTRNHTQRTTLLSHNSLSLAVLWDSIVPTTPWKRQCRGHCYRKWNQGQAKLLDSQTWTQVATLPIHPYSSICEVPLAVQESGNLQQVPYKDRSRRRLSALIKTNQLESWSWTSSLQNWDRHDFCLYHSEDTQFWPPSPFSFRIHSPPLLRNKTREE